MGSPLDWDIALRLLIASVLGGIIGLEREVHGRPAGFRTHLLVSLGSSLFVITSIYFYQKFGNFSGQGQIGVDPGRVAAQVVTGIGFLGAGAIIREKASIRGLTTAACLWVASAVGLSVGVGMYATAVFVTFLAVASLVLLKRLESRLHKDTYFWVKVWSADFEGQIAKIEGVLECFGMEVLNIVIEKDILKRTLLLDIQAKSHSRDECKRLCVAIAEMEGVTRLRLE